MAKRRCVTIPDDLDETIRRRLPDLNVSRVLADALRAHLGCQHPHYRCSDCDHLIDSYQVRLSALDKFYADLLWQLDPLVTRGGTAEGAARVAKEVGIRYSIPAAKNIPVPRPTRAEREAAKVKDFPDQERRRKVG